SLLQERRCTLHARIVDAIERLYPDRLAEQVERLAHHALRGEIWEKALVYVRQAGAKAFGRSAYREAVAWFDQALAALKHLPESRDTIEQAIDLRFDLRNSLAPLGEFRRILDYLREAETPAEILDDRRRLSRISSMMALCLTMIGDHDRAVESGQRALAIATALGDFGLQVTANNYLGQAHLALGDYRRAIDFLRRNVASLEGDLTREYFGLAAPPSVMSRTWLVRCLSELGEFDEGIARGEEAVRIAEAVDQPFIFFFAYWGLGQLYLCKGEFHKAIPVLEGALGLACPRSLACAPGTGTPGVCPPASRRDPLASRAFGCREGRGLLPSGHGAGPRTRDAPAPSPLPLRLGHAVF
ncbi:MAG: tetratricopeptide repeat protein, partial [candidate division NC10 bacterium]|nr:tetratricopeptide repeat protein [candidate division NC10 bacterium]